MKRNCWEFMNCGREVKGVKSNELGVCPVSMEQKLNGIHDGKNAGRACWVVSGTLCKGAVQGRFAKKYEDCSKCDFYKHVKETEHPKFMLSATLLSMLK